MKQTYNSSETQLLIPPTQRNQSNGCCGPWMRSLCIFALLVLLAFGISVTLIIFLKMSADKANAIPPSPQADYTYAAVAADAPQCSKIGSNILAQKRGSAVDAAIAAMLCVGVVNCHLTGIGGGFVMNIYDTPRNGQTKTNEIMNARETAPGASTVDMFVNKPGASVLGGLAIAVPGAVKGFWKAHQKYGRVAWEELFQPTIQLCEEGFMVHPSLASSIQSNEETIRKLPNMRRMFVKSDGKLYQEGDTLTFPELANTLRVIASEGEAAFYDGSLTNDITADLTEQGSIITKEDLNSYKALWKPTLNMSVSNGQYLIHSPPPPFGGLVYQYILNILDGYNFNKDSISDTESSILTYHRIVEAYKFAYAARSLIGDEDGDPSLDLTKLKQKLTSKEYGRYVKSLISDNTTHDTQYYHPVYAAPRSAGTSHLSVMAPDGAAVSITSTENLGFGSKVVGKRTGIIFNNQMDDFSTPNVTNTFGFLPSSANFIKPGKRPTSSMCASLIMDASGQVKLIIGASGGSVIPTSSAYVTMHTLWLGKTLGDALTKPRLHHQLFPKILKYEPLFPQAIINGLQTKGHVVLKVGQLSVVQAIRNDCDACVDCKQCIHAVCDRRRDGIPAGF